MFIVGLLQWWYGAGWKQQLVRYRERLAGMYDYFSIDLLARSLFAPYRQIAAGKVRGPLAVQWRAFVDRLVSRVIGAMVRSIVIVVGVAGLVLAAAGGMAMLTVWLAAPAIPAVGMTLWLAGWVPWRV